MARIERYNRIDKPDVEDIVIGTDRDDDNQTKNFRLGDILGLAEGVDLNFIGLEDTPSTYENSAGKIPVVRFEEQGLIFKDPSEVFTVGALSFLELDDTPVDYAGQALKVLRVTNDEAGVEFYDLESVLSLLQSDVSQNSTDIDTIEVVISQIQNTLNNKIDDAPSDGKQYVRKDGGWIEIDLSDYVLSSDLADVATSGDYDDLNNKPTIPTIPTNVSEFNNDANYTTESYVDGEINNLATVSITGNYNDLINKPTIPNTDDFVEKTGDTMSGFLKTPIVQEKTLTQTGGLFGNLNVDWTIFSNYDFTLTENSVITQTGVPISGYNATITIYVKGDYALILPTEWVVIGGNYDPNGTQFIVQSWDDGNFYCAIGGGEIDLSNYLQKSGDTMSGALTINKDLLALYLADGGLAVGTITPVSKIEIDYSTSLPNNINSNVNSWSSEGKSSFSIKGSNNRMSFGVDGAQNTRTSFIQVGHSSSAFANLTDSKLLLQPYGGNVGIGTTNPQANLHVSNGNDQTFSKQGEIAFSGDVNSRYSSISGYRENNSNQNSLSFSVYNEQVIEGMRLKYNGQLLLLNTLVFADNTSASSLETGTIYRTSDGTLKIKY